MAADKLNRNSTTASPFIYLNWLAANSGEKALWTCEYIFLTDARIIGEVTEGYGPYKFLNPIPLWHKPGLVQGGIVLRTEFYNFPHINLYHGWGLDVEIAALSSLALGIRLKSGGLIRRFEPNSDPLGRPVAYDYRPFPILVVGHQNIILPNVALRSASVKELEPLSWLLTIPPKNIISLIRAARLYQDALWIAESEPALSWIMLVSALETGAEQWSREPESPIERLNVSKPELVKLLKKNCQKETLEEVANLIERSLGATKKFIEFVLKFKPKTPPTKRPAEWAQIRLSNSSIKGILQKIYEYRSRALHAGIPFPASMCEPPIYHESWEACSERPIALTARLEEWKAEDKPEKLAKKLAKANPMLLHTFEYITRGTLLNWWQSLRTDNSIELS